MVVAQVILKTKRLILRSPRLSDTDDITEGIGNFEVCKNMSGVPYPYKKKDAKEWLNKVIKKSKMKVRESYVFMIELKKEKKVIGCLDLNKINLTDLTCQTGSWINLKYHQKGYITEAKIAVNEFAFNKLKMRKMETTVFRINKASNATQKSVGYRYEGCKIKSVVSKSTGKIYDVNMYGLLKEDWKKRLPKLRAHLEKKIKKLSINKLSAN
ncbi:MAG: GNAT family N-acetyltransferase [Nanoarchaeota archaeon]|nr:GNAT family N-acetyltransferase [Nanoarchaeota archaeon]